MSNNYIIYVLYNTQSTCTYVGITNKPDRRIRQHNGELVGGAKYTKHKKGEGMWKYYGWVKSIDGYIMEKNIALSLEKRIQIFSRKMKGKTPIERRLNTIEKLIQEYDGLEFIKLFNEI